MQEDEFLVKMVMKGGAVISLICDPIVLADLHRNPKFLNMRDTQNDIYVSVDDIAAYEIINNRVVEANEPCTPSEAA